MAAIDDKIYFIIKDKNGNGQLFPLGEAKEKHAYSG
jgi:hypothetical protein